jgi:hypothetical protein
MARLHNALRGISPNFDTDCHTTCEHGALPCHQFDSSFHEKDENRLTGIDVRSKWKRLSDNKSGRWLADAF